MIPASLTGEKPFLGSFPDIGELVTYNFFIRSAGFRKQKKVLFVATTRNNTILLPLLLTFTIDKLLAQLMLLLFKQQKNVPRNGFR